MAAPNGSTFDGNANLATPTTVGYRPGPQDFNGAALVDDPASPPDPQTMATSWVWNTFCWLIISICKAIGSAGFAVNASASPSMQSWWTAANLILGNPFVLTRVAAGNYTITWASTPNLLPVSGWPRARLNAVLAAGHSYSISSVNITNGVQIYTLQDTALADLNFSVEVF